MEDHKQQIPTENPNAEQDAIRKLLLLRDHINNDRVTDSGDVIETLTQLQGLYKELGGYLLTPTAELFPRAMDYFNAHIEDIRVFMTKHGVSNETVEAVTQDYGGVLMGQYTFRATPVQMLELLKKIKPYKAYFADKYVLYFGVMKQYAITVELAAKFNDAFRNEGATADTKKAFMDGRYSPTEALCLQSLRNRHFFTVRDFEGVEREQVINWLDNLEAFSNVGKYTIYYALASLALTASTEQLQEINAPELLTVTVEDFGVKTAQEYAERYTNNVRRKVEEMGGGVIELIEADTAQEREQAKQAVEDWESKTNKEPVRLYNTLLSIQTRPVYVADNEKAQYTAPIEMLINQYVRDKGIKNISPYKVEQVCGCINYLLRFGTPQSNGYITIETSLSALANEVLGFDANGEQKAEVLTALEVLDGAHIVIPSPHKVDAIRLLFLRQRTIHDTGQIDLVIDVSALVKKGAAQVISAADYKKLRKQSKSQVQNRFVNMLLSKGHKSEMAALDDIFGYTAEVDVAVRSKKPETEIKRIKDNQKKHLSRDKRKLEQMFEKAQADGLIKYTKKQTGIGKHKVPIFVYEWERLREPEIIQEPDEQDEQ